MKDGRWYALCGVLGLISASGVGLLLGRSEDNVEIARPVAPRQIGDWSRFINERRTTGPPDAPVDVIVFFDYECPYCLQSESALKAIRRRYPDSVRVSYFPFPQVALHPHAFAAALGAECAGEQSQFLPYHKAVTSHPGLVREEDSALLARLASVADTAAFRACVDSQASVFNLETQIAEAVAAGIKVTPTFLINGLLVQGLPSRESLLSMITRELHSESGMPAQ